LWPSVPTSPGRPRGLVGGKGVEERHRVLAAVAGEVAVVAVDHRQARAHEPREIEDGDTGAADLATRRGSDVSAFTGSRTGHLSPAGNELIESVRDACEDHARFEEEQPLDVERPLVVQQALRAADDELGHDHHRDRVRIGSDATQVE
jgi:hypothetical protein